GDGDAKGYCCNNLLEDGTSRIHRPECDATARVDETPQLAIMSDLLKHEQSKQLDIEAEPTYATRLRDAEVTTALGGLLAHKGPRTTLNELTDCIESAKTMIAMLQARKKGGE